MRKVAGTRKDTRKLFLFFVLLMSSGFSLGQESVANVVKGSKDAVVLIVTSDSDGEETALGSGFLISTDGEIVTNFHVIKGAQSIVVKVSKGEVFPGSILASDPSRDLAVIKVDGTSLPFLTLENDDQPQMGDHVVAIGSPLGLEGTVSDGLISSFREFDDKKWIQTSAPVSHGNSGGPLLDMRGKVVGVITRGSEEGQNLNFAIPSNELRSFLSLHGVQTSTAFEETRSGETEPAESQSSTTSTVAPRDQDSASKREQDAQTQTARAIGYVIGYFGLGLIPTWVALYRKHTYKIWVLVLNIVVSLVAFGAPATSPLQILASLGWVAVLVYSFFKHGKVDPRAQHPAPAYPHYPPQYYPQQSVLDRIEVLCPGCRSRLRIPTGRHGSVRCPRCSRIFEARS